MLRKLIKIPHKTVKNLLLPPLLSPLPLLPQNPDKLLKNLLINRIKDLRLPLILLIKINANRKPKIILIQIIRSRILKFPITNITILIITKSPLIKI